MTSSIPTDRIHPNKYNPNRMTDDEFRELTTEVEHLGRLPKPVVVRRNGDDYVIVDGEHGWRAAKELDLPEIPCEVIEADDFECMRQTYKRNQHGNHDPVLLGQMFERMMKARKLSRQNNDRQLSQRKLAKEIDVSEGTIRNALEYARAVKVRNDYAFSELSVKQVRWFNRLPKVLANLWLDAGADVDSLCKVTGKSKSMRDHLPQAIEEWMQWLVETGLLPYVTESKFEEVINQAKGWLVWEREWSYRGVEAETLRQYSKHHYAGEHVVSKSWDMDAALELIINPSNATFYLTPEEFTEAVESSRESSSRACPKTRYRSFLQFERRLKLMVVDKYGTVPSSDVYVKQQLEQREYELHAPDFINRSHLSDDLKQAMFQHHQRHEKGTPWDEDSREDHEREGAAIRKLATDDTIEFDDSGLSPRQTVKIAIRRIADQDKFAEQVQAAAEMSDAELAEAIVLQFYQDSDKSRAFADKLATFEKSELIALHDIVRDHIHLREMHAKIVAEMQ